MRVASRLPQTGRTVMKAIHWITAAAALAYVQPTPASAAQGDPEVIIYRFPGVFDASIGAKTGTATVFHCTNFSGPTETIRFVARSSVGNLLTNVAFNINHLVTLPAATHPTLFYQEVSLATGAGQQGTTAIAATTTSIICTAVTIDAANTPPTFAIPL